VLEAPFTSAVDVGAQHYWFLPVRLFMKDQFRSDLVAGKITAPVLVVHGEDDCVVPLTLGKRLYALIRSPKRFVSIARAGHSDLGARAVEAAKTVRLQRMMLWEAETNYRGAARRSRSEVGIFKPPPKCCVRCKIVRRRRRHHGNGRPANSTQRWSPDRI
jgi:fermentation-respiration switch protein FrsA (DUF1100 family)